MIMPNANSIENNRVNEMLFIISTRMSAESHYWLIHCWTISAVYGSGSSNYYFRFYQQNALGGLNIYIPYTNRKNVSFDNITTNKIKINILGNH
jgi:hypothetical protein